MGAEVLVVQISPTGLRNEYWRKRLLVGLTPPARYVQFFMTQGIRQHPKGVEAMAYLLTCPAQMDENINPWGDCDMLKVVFRGDTFYLKVDCYASDGTLQYGSPDPTDDEKTTRIFTCLLASEY